MGTLLALGINALLARLLSPADLGAYFLTFSLVTVLVLVAQGGGKQTMVRLVAASLGADDPGRARAGSRAVLLMGLTGSLVVAVALLLGGGQLAGRVFNARAIATAGGLVAAWVAVVTLSELSNEGHRALGDIRAAVVFGWITSNVVILGLLVALKVAQGRLDFQQVLEVSIAGTAVTLLLSLALFWRRVRRLPRGHIPARDVVTVSLPLLASQISLFLVGQSGLWILGILRPEDQVAMYGAAFRLVTAVKMPLLIANAVVPPFIADYYARGHTRELQTLLRTSSTAAAVPALLVLAVFVALGGPVLSLVFGSPYGAAATILALLSLGQAVTVWAGSADMTLMLTGHQFHMMMVTVVSGVFGIVASLWAGAHWGGVGVASAGLAAWTAQSVAMVVLARRLVGVDAAASFTPHSLRASWSFVREGLEARKAR